MSIAIATVEPKCSQHESNHAADSLVSGLSFMLVANLLQRGIGFVRNIILCRFLADEQLGLWALASSFFVLAAPLAVIGLPGTFGRMVESYRNSGQLNIFLKRVAICSMVGVFACSLWLIVAPSSSSSLIFGAELSQSTMLLVSGTLCLVILFNTATELLSGLRKPRIVSAMHTCNSMAFTITSLGGLWLVNDWRMLIAAFGASAAFGLIPAIPTFRNWHEVQPRTKVELPHRDMWARILPFAISIWCMNLMTNLFDVVDRYMLLYLASDSIEHGRALGGQFHSGKIMPALLSSLTFMISGILLPYLAAEWEAGKRREVGLSMQIAFKCATLFFVSLSVVSLAVAPLLFQHVLQGKYSDGLAIMPQAMLHCCLGGLAFLMQNYFWCAERGKTVGIIIAIGLVLNIVLNALMVPALSLYGAMLATSISGGAILLMTMLEMRRCGVPLGAPCLWFGLMPLSLALGCIPSATVLAIAFVVVSRTDWLMSESEKQALDKAIVPRLSRFGFKPTSLWSCGGR